MRTFSSPRGFVFLLFASLLAFQPTNIFAQEAPLERIAVINDLMPAPQGGLYIATQYGLLLAKADGMGTVMPGLEAGLTSLAAHPKDSQVFLTSGIASNGKAMGVMKSSDGGKSWKHISDAVKGPVKFRYMGFSHTVPNMVFGVTKDSIQMSKDGGITWKITGKSPENMFSFTVSTQANNTLYAATKDGILVSRNGGGKWDPAYSLRRPVTMVHAAAGGKLYAFVFGIGLIMTKEPSLAWKTLSKEYQQRYILNLAADPKDSERLYATANTGAIMTSSNGGKSWTSYEGHKKATNENIAKGKKVFESICQECHGVKGIGENPKDPNAQDEFGFLAPSLNDDAHAWHHSDSGITESIKNGSDRNERMIAFKDVLEPDEIENVLTYIKSLWNFSSLACQGARHMSCMNN